MARSMPIVADIPTADPGLGFREYVDALAEAVRGGQPPQFTIGLYGAWGSGKSSLLRAMAKSLTAADSEVLPVVFDAWRHERSEHIVVPLLYRICDAARRSGDRALTDHLMRAIKALIFSVNFRIAGVGVDTQAMKENWDAELSGLDEAFSKPFEEMRRLPETLDGKRVAVLVDDLDRCSPEKVVSLLEAINLVLDVPGFIFVLALDYDVLVNAVSAKYPHVSGHAFIEKMIQLPFRVPPLAVEPEVFIGELIPDWEVHQAEFPDGFSDSVVDIAEIGLRANPRQIKRLINSFLVLERIAERRKLRVDLDLMAALIGLQLRWPDRYQELQDAVLASNPDPFAPFSAAEDDGLERYRERFFSKQPANHVLREILQLTAVVATEASHAAKRPATELREEGRELLEAALPDYAFQRSPRSERLWYREGWPHFRIAMTKIGFRFERRSNNQEAWGLLMSMDYRNYNDGLSWLDEQKQPES